MDRVELFNEEWRDIDGFADYQASNLGRIRSKDRAVSQMGRVRSYTRKMKGKIIKPGILNGGYAVVWLRVNGVTKAMTVHRLVAKAFFGESVLDVNHKDGNRLNNRLDNLEYLTRSKNIEHSYRELGHKSVQRKRVVCVETGEMFDSIKEAAEAKGINRISIGHVLAGRYKMAGGLRWKRE